ncbi:hypothetical protein EDB84DRAFT_990275 [Lactarius hengduanensis]|nr:hypothetical protein EDB84DRAFT_990275 [Lactarius hengduanensis]
MPRHHAITTQRASPHNATTQCRRCTRSHRNVNSTRYARPALTPAANDDGPMVVWTMRGRETVGKCTVDTRRALQRAPLDFYCRALTSRSDPVLRTTTSYMTTARRIYSSACRGDDADEKRDNRRLQPRQPRHDNHDHDHDNHRDHDHNDPQRRNCNDEVMTDHSNNRNNGKAARQSRRRRRPQQRRRLTTTAAATTTTTTATGVPRPRYCSNCSFYLLHCITVVAGPAPP